MSSPFSFTLPPKLSAKAPPERRGVARDQVRLMVIARETSPQEHRQTFQVEHSRFDQLGHFLRSGDLLVFNSSRTLPAALEDAKHPQDSVCRCV
jgi:S-adenosylmethionine:tRNA ribosyltransferase-isomerase